MEDNRKRAHNAGNVADSEVKNHALYFSAWAGAVSTVLIGWNIDSIGTGLACMFAALATLGTLYQIIGGFKND
mgnify:CR=1 FL=1